MKKQIFVVTLFVALLDIASKYIIFNVEDFKVIKNFFYITKSKNTGAAFSLLSNNTFLIILINIIIFCFLIKSIKSFKINNRNKIAFGLIIGGLFGNLYDRILLGYVRDFLDFRLWSYNYPIFNFADTCICIGVILLIIAIMKGEDEVWKK